MSTESTPRLTPWELAFGAAGFEDDIYPAIREEADARQTDTSVPERFLMLAAAGDWLRGMRSDADAGDREAQLPPADVVRQYGALLFQAFRFVDRGRNLYTIGAPLLRRLLAAEPVGHWSFAAPADAGYIQLPHNLVWARIDDEAPAETVDGFFWSIAEPSPAQPGRIDLLLVLGMHPERPGFSVIEATAPLPAPDPGHWADGAARPEGQDFSNILPGGELRDLMAVVSTAEALKLASRLFHYIDTTPQALRPVPVNEPGERSAPNAMPASSLSASEITFVE